MYLEYAVDHGTCTSRMMIIFGPDGLSGWSSKRKPVKDPLQQGILKELIKA